MSRELDAYSTDRRPRQSGVTNGSTEVAYSGSLLGRSLVAGGTQHDELGMPLHAEVAGIREVQDVGEGPQSRLRIRIRLPIRRGSRRREVPTVGDSDGGKKGPPELPNIGGEDDESRARRDIQRIHELQATISVFSELVNTDPFTRKRLPPESLITGDLQRAVIAIEKDDKRDLAVRAIDTVVARVREFGPRVGNIACALVHKHDDDIKSARSKVKEAETALRAIGPAQRTTVSLERFLQQVVTVSGALEDASSYLPFPRQLEEIKRLLDAEDAAENIDYSIAGVRRRPELLEELASLNSQLRRRLITREENINRGTDIRMKLREAGIKDSAAKKAHRDAVKTMEDVDIIEGASARVQEVQTEGSVAYQRFRELLAQRAVDPAAELYRLLQRLQSSMIAITPDRQDTSPEARENLELAAQVEQILVEQAKKFKTAAIKLSTGRQSVLDTAERTRLDELALSDRLQRRLKRLESGNGSNGEHRERQETGTLTDEFRRQTRLVRAIITGRFERDKGDNNAREMADALYNMRDERIGPAERGLLVALATDQFDLSTMRLVLWKFDDLKRPELALLNAEAHARYQDIVDFIGRSRSGWGMDSLRGVLENVQELMQDTTTKIAIVKALLGEEVYNPDVVRLEAELSEKIAELDRKLTPQEEISRARGEVQDTSEPADQAHVSEDRIPGEKTVIPEADMDVIDRVMRVAEGVLFDPLNPIEEGDIQELPLDFAEVKQRVSERLTRDEQRVRSQRPEEFIDERIHNIIAIVEEHGGRLYQSLTRPILDGSYLIGIIPYLYQEGERGDGEVYTVGILENPMKDNATYGIIHEKVKASALYVSERFGKQAVLDRKAAFRVFHSKEEPVYHRGRVFKRLRKEITQMRTKQAANPSVE